MSFINLITNVLNPARVANGQPINARGTRDGLMYFSDQLMAYGLEGRIFNASVGISATPVTFAATGSWLITQPSLSIDVPSGTAIIPVSISLYTQAAAGATNQILALTGTSNFGAGTSTAVTPRAMRTDIPVGASGCTVNSLFSAVGVTPATPLEFWHEGYTIAAAAGTQQNFFWQWSKTAPVVIVGVGCLGVYVSGATAPTGYLKAQWIELPSSSIT